MGDAGFAALLVRTLLSLTVVLAIVGIAYLVARRKAGRTGPVLRLGGGGRAGRARRSVNALEVVGRVGLGRTAALVAVRFGDRVMLLSAGEAGTPNIVAEMPAEHWDDLHTTRDAIDPSDLTTMVAADEHPRLTGVSTLTPGKPGVVESLRRATARYG